MSTLPEQSQAGASGSDVKEGSTCTIENGALCSLSELAAKYHKQLCGSGCVPKPAGYISPRAGYTAGPSNRSLCLRAPVTEKGTMQLFTSSCSWYIICLILQPECRFKLWH